MPVWIILNVPFWERIVFFKEGHPRMHCNKYFDQFLVQNWLFTSVFLSKMDGSWLDEDHHDFLEELKMEILEEKKKEGILQAASRMKQV